MNRFKGSAAWRDDQFMSISLDIQLDIKSNMEYLTQALYPTHSEY
jgi:hypothetical protein